MCFKLELGKYIFNGGHETSSLMKDKEPVMEAIPMSRKSTESEINRTQLEMVTPDELVPADHRAIPLATLYGRGRRTPPHRIEPQHI